MKTWLQIIIFIFGLFTVTHINAEVMKVLIEKEIDDDHIIIVTEKGDRLFLEKWTMKLSPLLFEGKIFFADVTAMWVKIYIESKGEIKWSIEKHLGKIDLEEPEKSEKTASDTYGGVGTGHWIENVTSDGEIIILEDGSIWEVSPIDVIYTAIWLPVSNIAVIEDSGSYPYKLINKDDDEIVNAKYLGNK